VFRHFPRYQGGGRGGPSTLCVSTIAGGIRPEWPEQRGCWIGLEKANLNVREM